MKYINLIILLFLMPVLILGSVIAGYIRDAETKERIPFVNIYIEETMKGDMADSSGYFEISNIDAGKYNLIVRLIGYKEKRVNIDIEEHKSKFIEIEIDKEVLEIEGITVSTDRSDFKHSISISKKTYSREDFIKGPAVVQSDVLKIFQLLPSVTASSDFSSALYVRGGAPDQNLILFDNIPIFNPFHLGGLFSTFPVRAIETASFYAGGFDVAYGNRISSVIDIRTLIPDDKRFALNYDISMLSASAYIQAEPIKNLSFFINGRRTYFDKILELFDWDFPYYFYDLTFKTNYRIQQNSNIEFTWFIDRDIINLVLEDTLELFDDVWGNSSYGLTFNHVFNNHSDIELSVYRSEYDNTINLLNILKAHSAVEEKGIKGKYNINIDQIKIKSGFECYQNRFIYNITITDTIELFNINDKPKYYAGFMGIEWKKGNAFILNAGLRGEKYDYDRNIYFSPRAGFKFFIFDETAFSMNLGVYRQFITSVKQETNDFSSVFGEMYMPVYEQYSPQYLKQLTIGLEHWFDNVTTVSIECYKKEYENLIHSTLIDLILNMDDPKNAFTQNSGYSSGIELLIKRSMGNLTGWLGYSFSGTYIKRDTTYVPTYYDKAHSINVNASYDLPFSISLSTSLVFSTGSPFTAVIGKYKSYYIDHETGIPDGYSWEEIYSDYNAARFPSYFRWDMGISKKFNIGRMENKITISVVNVTNHDNVFFYYYNHNTNPSERHDFYMFPIFPSIGVSGEF